MPFTPIPLYHLLYMGFKLFAVFITGFCFLSLSHGAALNAGVNQAELQKKEAELQKNPNSLRVRFETATEFAKANQFEKVIELLNSYTDQLDANAFLLLASSYSSLKDYVNEVRVLKILSDKQEKNFRWHMLLGQAYIKQASTTKDPQRNADLLTSSILELRKTRGLNPKFKPAFDLLLKTFLDQKANNEARELVLEGIQRFGERPELYRELCRLDSIDGFLEQAVKFCRRSIELSSNFPDHYVYLVQALLDQDEDGQAERTIVNAAKRFQKSEFIQWAAGKVYLLKKNYPVAARYFLQATKADPKEIRSQFGLAQSLFESNKEAEALPHFILACKGDPSNLETFLSNGARLKQRGNSKLGAEYARAAINCKN